MDTAPSPSLSTEELTPINNSNPTVENDRIPKPINRRKKKRVLEDTAMKPPPSQPPSSSSVNKSHRVSYKLRSPKVVFAPVRRRGGVGDGDVEAFALPLGMSFAAVVAQVLERKDAAGERMSVDHLSMICTSAVRESLANVSQILTAHSSIDSGLTSQSFLMYLSTSDRPQNADLI